MALGTISNPQQSLEDSRTVMRSIVANEAAPSDSPFFFCGQDACGASDVIAVCKLEGVGASQTR